MIEKTLNETIDALVFCSEGLCEYCPCNKEDRHFCQDAKCAYAMYYLKEYKKLLEMLNKNEEIIIGEPTSTYKIELTKPEFKNIIIE